MQNFFSIIVPAYNEEKYLSDTLRLLVALDYPKDKVEVIVVENGSSDRTLETARQFEKYGVKVLQSEKGVSKAKNLGVANTHAQSNWIIFLDADTKLAPEFLKDLNLYLDSRKNDNLAIGTTTLRPEGKKRLYADLWFLLYNSGHVLTKTSFAIQIANAAYRNKIVFDVTRKFAEDLQLIKELRKCGKFFYFRTKLISTSTRRFDEVGWFRLFLRWNWQALVLSKTKRKIEEYGAVR